MKQGRPIGFGEADLELEQQYGKMTRQRNDNNGTEFEAWRRKQQHLSSGLGYLATDVDFIWRNYKTKQFIQRRLINQLARIINGHALLHNGEIRKPPGVASKKIIDTTAAETAGLLLQFCPCAGFQ